MLKFVEFSDEIFSRSDINHDEHLSFDEFLRTELVYVLMKKDEFQQYDANSKSFPPQKICETFANCNIAETQAKMLHKITDRIKFLQSLEDGFVSHNEYNRVLSEQKERNIEIRAEYFGRLFEVRFCFMYSPCKTTDPDFKSKKSVKAKLL